MELKTAKHNSGSFSRQVGTRHRYWCSILCSLLYW